MAPSTPRRNGVTQRSTWLLAIWLLSIFLVMIPGAVEAQQRTRTLPNYKHEAFTLDRGAPASIYAIAQTPDGFLWLGSLNGLYRFDGVTFERVMFPKSLGQKSDWALSLLADRAGNLWILTDRGGVTVWRDGRFRDMNVGRPYPGPGGLVEDPSGAVWVLSSAGRGISLGRFVRERWEVVGKRLGLPGKFASSILAGRDGTIWIASDAGLAYWRPGTSRFILMEHAVNYGAGLAEAADGSIWTADKNGVRMVWDGIPSHRPTKYAPTFRNVGSDYAKLRFDSIGNLWLIVPGQGVKRIARPVSGNARTKQSQIDSFDRSGLSSPNTISNIFDREGNLWIGTELGLDQFRGSNFTEVLSVLDRGEREAPDTTSNLTRNEIGDLILSVFGRYYRPAPDGTAIGFNQLSTSTGPPCISEDGVIWKRTQRYLVRLGARPHEKIALPAGLRSWMNSHCAINRDQIWLAGGGGLFRYQRGRWDLMPVNAAAPTAPPYFFNFDEHERMLAYMGNESLYRFDGRRFRILIPEAKNPIQFINLIERIDGKMYLLGTAGIARLEGSKISVLPRSTYPILDEVSGIAVGKGDQTWLTTRAGLLLLSTRELDDALNSPGKPLGARLFTPDDGLDGFSFSFGYDNPLAIDRYGRLWIATNNGVFSINPRRLRRNGFVPPVSIAALVSNGRVYAPGSIIRLPSGASDLQINYTAASLVNSSRIRFRYRLVGQEWIDPGPRREAVYTNLPPGNYKFQVIAANADGVWNTTGASLEFSIPPTFLQSRLFALLCIGAAVLVAAMLYWLRVRQVTARLRLRLEDRLRERERIARELHDTLLQSVQGLIYRFQNVADDIQDKQGAHAEMLEALDRADDVLAEGRKRVHGLRGWSEDRPLAAALEEIARKAIPGGSPRIDVKVGGNARTLNPGIAAELIRVAEEAILNCVKHARATVIEVGLSFEARRLHLSVEDDGIGIPANIAEAGRRSGHFGLIGMRERSARIGGDYKIKRRLNGGTEIIVSVPADIAYANPSNRLWNRFWRRTGREELA